MKINIDIDDNHEETRITIQAKEWTQELEEIVNIIKKNKQQRLLGVDEEQTILLEPKEIDFIHSEKRKTYAVSKDSRFEVKMKLYEVEEFLIPHGFMRFSKSVIGNIHRIKKFEASFNGNLCVYFQSGSKEYITRKYVGAIKDELIKGGQ
ncbi:LytTR family DNA-binding domain-containing protein [Pseudogracilibacillus sp. SO30301A]|uniref:LytTR family DNA-binding domain-containing protein n=1 Tax=Pseudogracilibacillus sp. SO30301A TaxID=3098291 RepID=UPI00300E1174